MKKESLGKLFVLSLITFGIYSLYWYVMSARQMREKGQTVANNWYLFAPMVVAVVAIFGLIAFSINNNRITDESAVGMAFFYLAFIVAGIASLYWYWTFCVAGETLTGGMINRWIALLLAWFISPIVTMLWFQYEFNKMADGTDLASARPTPVAGGEDLSASKPTPQPGENSDDSTGQ